MAIFKKEKKKQAQTPPNQGVCVTSVVSKKQERKNQNSRLENNW